MKIEIEAIDPAKIRYSTCGDWQWLEDGTLRIEVPDFRGNKDSAFLVAIHELVEAWLCNRDGITEAEVSAWDINNPELEEPGDSKNAPYHRQHAKAMAIEKKLCQAMTIDWREHQLWVEDSANEVDRCRLNIPQSL
jgi:hypothetical protein